MLNIMGSVQEVDRKKGFIKKTERARQRKTPRSERERKPQKDNEGERMTFQ